MSPRLDQALLFKIAEKTGKSIQYVREQISKRASRLGVVSEAAQILWAKELGIGTAGALQKQPANVQDQVRATVPIFEALRPTARPKQYKKASKTPLPPSPLNAAIEYLLQDEELKKRCADLLKAKSSFDRVFREATTVLDDRLKRLAKVKGKIDPTALVAKVLHPNNAILVVSDNTDEQEGFFSVCKGLMLTFRNPAHHTLNDKLTREDALRFCGFVDALLAILQQAKVELSGTT